MRDEQLIVLIGHQIKMLTTQDYIWMLGGHNSLLMVIGRS
jgi:hypothetical protein